MAFTDVKLSALDPAAVAQAEAFLATWLAEEFPDLDLAEGRVFRELLIRPAALFHVMNQTQMSLIQQSNSILAISKNPALSDPALVDAVLSNYRITRNPGAKSAGQVAIVLSAFIGASISQGTTFTSNGLVFKTASQFVGVTTQDAIQNPAIQRLIVKRNDGTFSFIVDVVADQVGIAYKLRRGTVFDAVSPTPFSFVSAIANQDFTGGVNAQTNSELVALFKQGISPAVYSGRSHIEAMLRAAYANITAVSIVGFGDAEMLRDRHNIFNVSQGGKADLYVRTQAYPNSINVNKKATLVDAASFTWQIALGKDDAPGFYAVEAVTAVGAAPDASSLPILSDSRGLDLTSTDEEFVPDIVNMIEGGFSAYQTSVIQFTDTANAGPGPTDYTVRVLAMPGVKDLQSNSINRANRNPNADYLVRAPIPAFCSVSLTVEYVERFGTPNVDNIKANILNSVAALDFTLGRLPASLFYDAAVAETGATKSVAVSPVDLRCNILKPAGGAIYLRSPHEIVIPNLPAEGISSRTVAFLMSNLDVDVNLKKVSALPI